MRALVTGAAGFIGSHLVEALLSQGTDVTALDCFTPYYDVASKRRNCAGFDRDPRCDFVEADLRTASIEPLLDGVDVIFHQAAQPGVRASWDGRFGEYAGHNVLATQRILEAARRAGVPRVVHASSSSVYGNAARQPTPEDALAAPFSPYGVTKLAAEHLCQAYAQNFGLLVVCLRYFTVFGPRQRPDMGIHRLIEAALRGTPFRLFGDGSQVRDFTYVGDVVAANLAAARAAVTPGLTCNIAGGEQIELRELVAVVEAAVGRPISVEPDAAMAGDVLRSGGLTTRARQLLGWEPAVSLRVGIGAQVAWHRSLSR